MTKLIEDLIRHPARVSSLTPEARLQAIHEIDVTQMSLASLKTALMVSLVQAPSEPAEDRLIEVREAARRLECSENWIKKNEDRLPFVRRLSPRVLRCSERALLVYMRGVAEGASPTPGHRPGQRPA